MNDDCIGSDFDDFLDENGLRENAETVAKQRMHDLKTSKQQRPVPGLYAGQLIIMPNFDDPMDEF